MTPRRSSRRNRPKRKTALREVRIELPAEVCDLYQRVADDQHITLPQVVARVAVEFAAIEKEAGDSRRRVLEALRRERLDQFGDRPGTRPSSAAELYTDLFAELFGFDRAKLTSFFHDTTEDTSLINQRGVVLVGAARPDCRICECYAERDSKTRFRTGDWPIEVECRSGGVSLLFTGEQFSGVPVLVEFAPNQRFGLPQQAECALSLRRGTTMLLKSYAEPAEPPAADFERIALLVSELAKRDALEPLPGLDKKGLIIKLESTA